MTTDHHVYRTHTSYLCSRCSKDASRTEKKRRLVKYSIYNMAALVILEICVFFYIDEQHSTALKNRNVAPAAAQGIANLIPFDNSELKNSQKETACEHKIKMLNFRLGQVNSRVLPGSTLLSHGFDFVLVLRLPKLRQSNQLLQAGSTILISSAKFKTH